nr:SDR family NAD(P)-dependent oxidoreductase [Rhodococcus sp. HNM0569]
MSGSVALVTGASAGIGAAVADRLAARGAHVLVHGRDAERTRAVAAHVHGTAILGDLADPAGRHAVVEHALAARGRVDILVANAGAGWSGPLPDMSVAHVRSLLELDLVASIELTHALVPAMVHRGHGAVCFVSSIAGRTGVAGEAVYSAAKAGVDVFAESLRAETAGTGVSVGVVVPGAVDTGFFDHRGRRYDRAFPAPVPPDRVADAIVRVVEGGRAEEWVPRWLRLAPAVRALAPGPYRYLATRFGEPVRIRSRGDGGGRDGADAQ